MASTRISFRARKILKHETPACSVLSSDGAPQTRKKRKPPQGEEEEQQTCMPASKDLVASPLLSAVTPSFTTEILTSRTDIGGNRGMVKQIKVSFSSLSEMEAIAMAIQHLKGCDAKLGEVSETSHLPSFQSCTSPFRSLVRSIVYQQLATKAAAAIYNRLLILCGGESSLSPTVIAKLSPSELRSIGISARKASYLHDLSKNFLEGGLSDSSIMLMEDEELLTALTAVKGIGVWSVHMFMIFSLHRPDVLPVSDLGVRKGFVKLYDLKALPTPLEMEQISAPWRPYRSLGAWYMWRLVERKAPVIDCKEKG